MGVRISWNDLNGGEDGHKVYRSTSTMDPEALPAPIATVGANVTHYDDGDVVEDTTYFYRVSAYIGGSEAVSDEISITPTTGLPIDYIHHYTFDDAQVSGSTLTDLGSAGVNGTINAGITTGQTGIVSGGEAFAFDGSDNANVTVTGHNFWTSAFSYHQIVERTVDTGDIQGIYTAGDTGSSTTDRDFDIGVNASDLVYVVFSNGSNYVGIVNTNPNTIPPVGTPFMLSVKWDGTLDPGGIVIKFDNVVVGTGQMTEAPAATGKVPRFGGRRTSVTYEWNGLQDECKIFARFTSDTEDAALAANWGF